MNCIDVYDIPNDDKSAVARGQVLDIEDAMRAVANEHHVALETKHYFADGLYAREIFIPKGTLLTGKIHLFEHLNVISKGDISVMTEDGIKRIVAPATIISKPGIKRIGYAHEDTVWTTFHAYKGERDGEKAEQMLVVDTYEQFALKAQSCHLLP